MAKIDIDSLLNSVDLEYVAEQMGIELKEISALRRSALCPFHADTNPSLLIDLDRSKSHQHYYCFACNANGNAIDLVKEIKGIKFLDAVDWLASAFSIQISKTRTELTSSSLPVYGSGLELGVAIYKNTNDEEGLASWAATRNFQLNCLVNAGFCYSRAGSLTSFAKSNSLGKAERLEMFGMLEDAYLVKNLPSSITDATSLYLKFDEDRRYSDFFVGDRITFPIYDDSGQLVGIGGRATPSAAATGPKYLFTKNFPKARVLYRADSVFRQVIDLVKKGSEIIDLFVCEGFLDAIRLESLGLLAVAAMGSALTKEQISLLKNLRDSLPSKTAVLNIIVAFDRDEAGLRGASASVLSLIKAGLDVRFFWPTEDVLTQFGGKASGKDPDEYLQAINPEHVPNIILESCYGPAVAVLAFQFGVSADDLIIDSRWSSAALSRKGRSFEKAKSELRKVVKKDPQSLASWITYPENAVKKLQAINDWIIYHQAEISGSFVASEYFLHSADARLNHARLLAYRGARRGELACDEPRWERLDIAATGFNVLFQNKLVNNFSKPLGPFDAVWVPRGFGSDEPRLKVMPRPEDLTVHQYLMNEILTERWDNASLSENHFSKFVPAVRYYREQRKTITTGFGDGLNDLEEMCLEGSTLSFAYQIDMDVIEGRQPASDQGMFRQFHDCWREFIECVQNQATAIGYVHTVRLDVNRYYDKLRRRVVRDSIQPLIQQALATTYDDTPEFAQLIRSKERNYSAVEMSSVVVDGIGDLIFGYPYFAPNSGETLYSDDLRGIPQGPVISAWLGSVALFPVDRAAYRFMNKKNVDGVVRVGYARYVDDIVLLADSAFLLDEFRSVVEDETRKLDLLLLAKSDEIPAMSSADFSDYISQGRALDSSGPAWEPPIVGDGEAGWDFWNSLSSDRQSALNLLSNLELYKASKEIILKTVRTAFIAKDLRASELSKGARLIWYAISEEVLNCCATQGELSFKAWSLFQDAWTYCTDGSGWTLNPDIHPWESPVLFALEGLEKLLDHKNSDLNGLTASENKFRMQRVNSLAKLVLEKSFNEIVWKSSSTLEYQTKRRIDLIEWKAAKSCGISDPRWKEIAELSSPFKSWVDFDWLHLAVERLIHADLSDDVDPLQSFSTPYNSLAKTILAGDQAAYNFFGFLIPQNSRLTAESSAQDTRLSSIALQVLIAVTSRECIFNLLARRERLLGSNFDIQLLIMPPLPGVALTRLVACKIVTSPEENSASAVGIELFEIAQDSPIPPQFIGSDGRDVFEYSADWEKTIFSGMLTKSVTSISTDNELQLKVLTSNSNTDISLKSAAKLYKSLVIAITKFSELHPNLELIPAWPYIAIDPNTQSCYLIADGVEKGLVGNRAFAKDTGRLLRSVEIPIFEAHLWRAGIALSDYLGFQDDIRKFSSANTELPLDDIAVADPARFVLRSQFRKLRGAFANSNITKRTRQNSTLPATIERALELLDAFPEDSESNEIQLYHLLATEIETAAMRVRYEDRLHNEPTVFLSRIVTTVLSRLPLSLGLTLSSKPINSIGIRRDLTGVLAISRKIWGQEDLVLPAWSAFKSGLICVGVRVALNGFISTLRSHGGFPKFEGGEFPLDWNISISPQAEELATANPKNAAWATDEGLGLLELMQLLVSHLGHRLRIGKDGAQISATLAEEIKRISVELSNLGSISVEGSSHCWPFDGIKVDQLAILNLELLESVTNLVRALDLEFGFHVLLIKEQSYGYKAQQHRFVDSKDRTWSIQKWMISQYPRNARHVEEQLKGSSVLKVWSEVHDKNSGRLLSVSVLGEPFASIALVEEDINDPGDTNVKRASSSEEVASPILDADLDRPTDEIQTKATVESTIIPGKNKIQEPENTVVALGVDAFRKNFKEERRYRWQERGKAKNKGHVRVAYFQFRLDISYVHPMVETNPLNWPFDVSDLPFILDQLQKNKGTNYEFLIKASQHGSEHMWTHASPLLPSWGEHRRRRMLADVIDACESFQVDLLVLPEYAVRKETIIWLKQFLRGKKVAILAGTYMEFERTGEQFPGSAKLNLLWPLPLGIVTESSNFLAKHQEISASSVDELNRGYVLSFERRKKYRSIGLEECINPTTADLKALFRPINLIDAIVNQLGVELTSDQIVKLLADTALPLKHFLELICSEIFLVTSPVNYLQMESDYQAMQRRFGNQTEDNRALTDLNNIAECLSIGGSGDRRSILAVPAATTRSADYWIAGQAALLAAATTTVFCNGTGGLLCGGSCFIGRESWKNANEALGFLPSMTPYHGWSKGIYYNSKKDPLGKTDQALVIADIDPYNMVEGKPRPQVLPVPLQLVAYLPVAETCDLAQTQMKLHSILAIEKNGPSTTNNKVHPNLGSRRDFWNSIQEINASLTTDNAEKLSKFFADPEAFMKRAAAAFHNNVQQPYANQARESLLTSPSFYDWIEVDMTLDDFEKLVEISVPAWTDFPAKDSH